MYAGCEGIFTPQAITYAKIHVRILNFACICRLRGHILSPGQLLVIDYKGTNLQLKTLAVSAFKAPTDTNTPLSSEEAKSRWADGGVVPVAKMGMVVAST
jgi:hypothetical protein